MITGFKSQERYCSFIRQRLERYSTPSGYSDANRNSTVSSPQTTQRLRLCDEHSFVIEKKSFVWFHFFLTVLAIPLSSMMSTWLIFHCPCSLSVFVVSIHRYVYEFVDDYGVRFLKDMFVDKWGI